MQVNIKNARFSNSSPQSSYFLADHPWAGVFKGMAVILEEKVYVNASKLQLSARNSSASPLQSTAAASRFSTLSQTSSTWFQITAKRKIIKFYFCPSSTLNWTLLSNARVSQNNSTGNINSCQRRLILRRMFSQLSTQSHCPLWGGRQKHYSLNLI